MPRKRKPRSKKTVASLKHSDATRKNIPTAEYQSVMRDEEQSPIRVAYERRNRDLDPQLVWRGKDEQDWSDLVAPAAPLYIQEKVHPKVLIDDLVASGKQATKRQPQTTQTDLFADFNGLPEGADRTDFYQHDANWSNRMILGDSLQVMASLAEREGLRGKVQCIYIDPPYGIKFNSNFQWSTTSRDVKDGKAEHITREPEQVKAFRDTWRDGIHSYLTYLRDRLTVARDLLTESGSIFVQIGDENVHRVRALMDEVFGEDNFVSHVAFSTTTGRGASYLDSVFDILLWYCKSYDSLKYRPLFLERSKTMLDSRYRYIELDKGEELTLSKKQLDGHESKPNGRRFRKSGMTSQGVTQGETSEPFVWRQRVYRPSSGRHWSTDKKGLKNLSYANRIAIEGKALVYKRFDDDYPLVPMRNMWTDTGGGALVTEKIYVVQTVSKVVERCLLMTTDPGDLVLDPTCGSGTTAYIAEQWGRRWITIDTSRVALALARARLMGARYPYYILADSPEGRKKEAELSGKVVSGQWPVVGGQKDKQATKPQPLTTSHYSLRQGFVYERVPHITLKSIANNAEIDVIYEKWQPKVQKALADLNAALRGHKTPFEVTTGGRAGKTVDFSATGTDTLPSGEKVKAYELLEWEVPREAPPDWPQATQPLITAFWQARISRQKEIDASIAAKADSEYLYDKPYTDNKKVRVAGPFTAESLSPHRVLAVDENDELIDKVSDVESGYGKTRDFAEVILENLKTAGVQQAHKEDRINFTTITPWPGHYVCAEGVISGEWPVVSDKQKQQTTSHKPLPFKRMGIFVGPEFGTVARPDLVAAAREAGDAGFDAVLACAFNYDAHSSEFEKLGRIPVLKARMNADLHMADDLKNTGKGNLFVIFGEPDVEVVSGLWLVNSNGRMVANYEQVKKLSGLGSLEEINRLGREDLSGFKELSAGRKVRSDEPNTPGGGVGTDKHRGGSSEERHQGVSEFSEHGERIAGGSGDAADSGRASENVTGSGDVATARASRGDQPYARWAKTLAALEALEPSDFPLELTTNHYTQITLNGVDVFHPQTGEVRSDGAEAIACWFIDTDYNEESFFVRHAYFLGAGDPYKSLKTTLKAEINEEAWSTLYSDTSRPFEKPESGRIAVKVINHLGDEVMKVFRV